METRLFRCVLLRGLYSKWCAVVLFCVTNDRITDALTRSSQLTVAPVNTGKQANNNGKQALVCERTCRKTRLVSDVSIKDTAVKGENQLTEC